MPNLAMQIMGYLSGTSGVNAYTNSLGTTSSTSSSATESFASVLTKLDSNIENATVNKNMYLKGFSLVPGTSGTNVTPTPDIDSIVQAIKNDKGGSVDIESAVKKYLSENFGDSKLEVIQSLSGVSSLPTQVTALQEEIYRNIVSKIAAQVRDSMYADQSNSNMTVFYSSDTDNETGSASSTEDGTSVYDLGI